MAKRIPGLSKLVDAAKSASTAASAHERELSYHRKETGAHVARAHERAMAAHDAVTRHARKHGDVMTAEHHAERAAHHQERADHHMREHATKTRGIVIRDPSAGHSHGLPGAGVPKHGEGASAHGVMRGKRGGLYKMTATGQKIYLGHVGSGGGSRKGMKAK
jgi:hypothetical protein